MTFLENIKKVREVKVSGYFRKSGYVRPHTRSFPCKK